MCQARRTMITVMRTAPATATYRPRSARSRLSRIGRTWRPMKMNVDEERARVIQQALAFEDCQDSVGRPQRAEHGGRGSGVGWGDHGAKHDCGRPGHLRHQRASDQGHCGGCQSYRKHNQAHKRRPVVLQVPRGRVIRRIQQHGRDEKRKCELRRYSERGRAGSNARSAPPSARNTG